VDTGMNHLFRMLGKLGAEPGRLRILVAGGAQVMDVSGFFNIGKRNFESLNQWLARHGLQIANAQVGGLVNRTMYLNLATGACSLKVSGNTTEVSL